MELISVIVPVYKVEAYLDKCVESIVNQTYTNLEIILVDDGSPDNCPAMCDEWAKRDERIKVIHKENGGLSDARNAGLEQATGEFIAFVDSDDWIEKQYIEFLYQAIIRIGADMSACQVRIVQECEEVFRDKQPIIRIDALTPEEAMYSLISGGDFRAVAWNKLYKRACLKDETFEVGKLHEDEFFTYRIIDKCKKIAWVDVLLYNYLQRSGSIMSTYSIRHLDALEASVRRLELLENKYLRLYTNDKVTFCVSCLNYYCDMVKGCFGEKKQEAKKRILDYRAQIRFSFSEWISLPIKNKIYVFGSTKILISIFARMRNLRGYS